MSLKNEKKGDLDGWYDAPRYSPSPSPNFVCGEDNGIPVEVPCEYDLRGCEFISFGEGYDYWVIAEEYPVHFEESVRLNI